MEVQQRSLPAAASQPQIWTGTNVIDLAAEQVLGGGEDTVIRLTPTEWHLVEVLLRARVSRGGRGGLPPARRWQPA